MLTSEHLEGRVQCVTDNFVCINLHFKKSIDPKRSFIEQIYINPCTGVKYIPSINICTDARDISSSCLNHFGCYIDIKTFVKEANNIATQFIEIFEMLNVDPKKELPQ